MSTGSNELGKRTRGVRVALPASLIPGQRKKRAAAAIVVSAATTPQQSNDGAARFSSSAASEPAPALHSRTPPAQIDPHLVALGQGGHGPVDGVEDDEADPLDLQQLLSDQSLSALLDVQRASGPGVHADDQGGLAGHGAVANESAVRDDEADSVESFDADERPARKVRRENRSSDRYQATHERRLRARVELSDPAKGLAAHRRGLVNLEISFFERAARDGGFGALFISHPDILGPPNGRPKIPYFHSWASDKLATGDPGAKLIPPDDLFAVSERLVKLSDSDSPVPPREIYDIMTTLSSIMVKRQQEAVIEGNTKRNQQRLAELARVQQEAETRAAEAEAAKREAVLAREKAEEDVKRREAEVLSRLVLAYMSTGMTENEARSAATRPAPPP